MVIKSVPFEIVTGQHPARKPVDADAEFERVRQAADRTRSRITTAFNSEVKIRAHFKSLEA